MDLTTLAIATGEGQTLTLRHPASGVALVDDEKKPITITLLGMDSEPFRAAMRRIANLQLSRKAKYKTTAEALEEDAIATLAECTLGWSGIVVDGKKLTFSKAAAKTLYARPDLAWLKDQVDEFIGERANFLKASPKT